MQSRLRAQLARELQSSSGLSEADYSVLVELSEAPEDRLRLGELSGRLEWDKGRLSKQVSRMTARGLVCREDCPTDARGAFAVLTDEGRKTIEAAAPLHAEQVRKWFSTPLTTAQLKDLTAISAAIVDRLDRPAHAESEG